MIVGYVLRCDNITLKNRKGGSPTLTSEDVDGIKNFVNSSSTIRTMTYLELTACPIRYSSVSKRKIQSELRKTGYRHQPAHKNFPVSEQTRVFAKNRLKSAFTGLWRTGCPYFGPTKLGWRMVSIQEEGSLERWIFCSIFCILSLDLQCNSGQWRIRYQLSRWIDIK